MKYYSTNHSSPAATLREAVTRGLAPDRGLYMPKRIERLPEEFFRTIHTKSFNDIAATVAGAFFGEDIPADELRSIVDGTLSFDCPVKHVEGNIHCLELFHGPTLAFKDVGARFMARLLQHFIRKDGTGKEVNVLVATSGDTGSAVANGFLAVEGINVYVLYPKGKVSSIQESQFTTLGHNITALEIDGTFDDCQALVKKAFMDEDLKKHMNLTSANSINVARFLPQAFYYFNAYARMKATSEADNLVVAVPSGNFGNLTAGLFAHRMGLPVKRFIAANNANDVFCRYLHTATYTPGPSIQTVANAMDVGDPSNFARIIDLYAGNHAQITALISGEASTDSEILQTIAECHARNGYTLDPHGACAFRALSRMLQQGETGLFLETAHPAKFKPTVENATKSKLEIPERLAQFMKGKKQSTPLDKTFATFKSFLMSRP